MIMIKPVPARHEKKQVGTRLQFRSADIFTLIECTSENIFRGLENTFAFAVPCPA